MHRSTTPEKEPNALEEAAGEHLGVDRWDRPAIFRESAGAATDNGLPYWMVLVLSGGIATLGLAINSSAVVIGAMLVAPLLAPVVGLALALAVGDGRLAVQTVAVVAGSTVAVVVISALLTLLLPFQTITLEIAARTQPTTLDLVIAVFSGLVGVVVTVARGSRLSAAIPGVAISVALIPPLAVTGFGIGMGWNLELIYGSMLLYGANLAGIVLSGMVVFMLVGMHRPYVVEAARTWHTKEEKAQGVSALADRVPWLRSVGVFRSPWSRIALVMSFVIALGFPLSESLAQIARETRVERAVGDAAQALFDIRDRSSILSRQVVYGSGAIQVYLRVATTEWFGAETREDFERRASGGAREPVRLSLEQLPARGEDLDQLVSLLPRPEVGPVSAAAPLGDFADIAASTRLRLRQIEEGLVPPPGVDFVRLDLTLANAGRTALTLTYAADEPLQSQAADMLRGQLVRVPDLPDTEPRLVFISTAPLDLAGAPADSSLVRTVARLLDGHERLAAEILAPEDVEDGVIEGVRRELATMGVSGDRVRLRTDGSEGLRLRVIPALDAGSREGGP